MFKNYLNMMKWPVKILTSSIGRKLLMSVTGLVLCGFMFMHLAGNFLLFKGPEEYDHYAELLLSNPLILFAEIGLLALFLIHICMGVWVRWEDWRNRSYGYVKKKWAGGRTIGSATMLYTAGIILAFLAYHILTFKYVDHSQGVYYMVMTAFQDPVYVGIYMLSIFALVLHLSHGFQSAFQTLGVNHPKYTPFIKLAGFCISALMVGFASIALFFFFGVGGGI